MTLTTRQQGQLAAALDARRATLLEEIRDELERSENLQYAELIERAPADAGDQSVADALADLNLAIVDRHVAELRDIDAAKARIAAATFGTCKDCGEAVPFDRLVAYPTAKRCLRCQALRERTYPQPGHPTL